MRKILVVVVIAGVACVEPAPQTPDPQTPVSTGTDPPSDVELTFGPVIASGTEAGRSWYLRGQIDERGASIWLEISSAGGGCGGGGIGALPFQDLGWTKLGHFGSGGWGDCHGTGDPGTFSVDGVVSK